MGLFSRTPFKLLDPTDDPYSEQKTGRSRFWLFIGVGAVLIMIGSAIFRPARAEPEPTPTLPAATATASPTATITETATPTPTLTPTFGRNITATPAATQTPVYREITKIVEVPKEVIRYIDKPVITVIVATVEIRSTVIVTTTPAATQTPWIVEVTRIVEVTPTFTPSPTPTETPTETPTGTPGEFDLTATAAAAAVEPTYTPTP